MFKWESLWLAAFLGFLVMCLCTLLFFMLIKFANQEGESKQQRRENEKAALVLREERKKMEELLQRLKKERTDE